MGMAARIAPVLLIAATTVGQLVAPRRRITRPHRLPVAPLRRPIAPRRPAEASTAEAVADSTVVEAAAAVSRFFPGRESERAVAPGGLRELLVATALRL
jgi:hypothetical protein